MARAACRPRSARVSLIALARLARRGRTVRSLTRSRLPGIFPALIPLGITPRILGPRRLFVTRIEIRYHRLLSPRRNGIVPTGEGRRICASTPFHEHGGHDRGPGSPSWQRDCFVHESAAKRGRVAAQREDVSIPSQGGSHGEETKQRRQAQQWQKKVRCSGVTQSRTRYARAQARYPSFRSFAETGDEPQTSDCDRPVGSAPGRREGAEAQALDPNATRCAFHPERGLIRPHHDPRSEDSTASQSLSESPLGRLSRPSFWRRWYSARPAGLRGNASPTHVV